MARWGQSRAFQKGQKPIRLVPAWCEPCRTERPFNGRRCMVCKTKRPALSKYGNKPVRDEVTGKMIHSKLEHRRLGELRLLEDQGIIRGLRTQVPYRLEVGGLLITTYRADFVYMDVATGREIVEDAKGFDPAIYTLKKRLMLACYGIAIQEYRR